MGTLCFTHPTYGSKPPGGLMGMLRFTCPTYGSKPPGGLMGMMRFTCPAQHQHIATRRMGKGATRRTRQG
jgi:hypothetical protein